MKRLILVMLLAAFATPANQADWRRWAVVCGNIMTNQAGIPRAIAQTRREGCWSVEVVPLFEGDTYLVYGTKIVGTDY